MSLASLFIANQNPASIPAFPLTARSMNLPPSKLFRFDSMSDLKRLGTPPSPLVTPSGNVNAETRTLRSASSRQPIPPAQRPSANPLLKTKEQARNERREGYLNRVRQQREENRWNLRGDQILQRDYLTELRAWEAEQARAAPDIDPDFDNDTDDQHGVQAQPSSSRCPVDSQLPWFQTASQSSNHMDLYNSQPPYLSQPSQHQYQQYREPGWNAESSQLINSNEQAEIDEILAAEERELEALVALHYGETPPTQGETNLRSYGTNNDMWSELPEIRHDEQGGLGDAAAANAAASPTWSSDDAEFEAELLRLGVDAMDVSGG